MSFSSVTNKNMPRTPGGKLLLAMFNEATTEQIKARAASDTHAASLRRALGVTSPFAALSLSNISMTCHLKDDRQRRAVGLPEGTPDTITAFLATEKPDQENERASSVRSAFYVDKK